jgi:hypothetical protein
MAFGNVGRQGSRTGVRPMEVNCIVWVILFWLQYLIDGARCVKECNRGTALASITERTRRCESSSQSMVVGDSNRSTYKGASKEMLIVAVHLVDEYGVC